MDISQQFDLPELVKIDEKAPLFEAKYYDPKTQKDGVINLEEQSGKWTVLFFYPADFTFVCPTELKDMADAETQFNEMWVEILAISTDSVVSHRAWINAEKLMNNFPYKMLADKTTAISDIYNLLDTSEGTAGRGTIIIDPDLVVRGIEVTSGPLGRNSEELIRKLQALQFMREHPTQACPAKWAIGGKTLTPSLELSGKVGDALEA